MHAAEAISHSHGQRTRHLAPTLLTECLVLSIFRVGCVVGWVNDGHVQIIEACGLPVNKPARQDQKARRYPSFEWPRLLEAARRRKTLGPSILETLSAGRSR
jgi:hypothetical protein